MNDESFNCFAHHVISSYMTLQCSQQFKLNNINIMQAVAAEGFKIIKKKM